MRQAHLNGDFTLLRLPKPVDQFQQYSRQPRPGIPVSQPHDRPLATLYPLGIDDKECEGALGITPHVIPSAPLSTTAIRDPTTAIYRLPSLVAPLGDPYLRFLQTPQQERYRCIPK